MKGFAFLLLALWFVCGFTAALLLVDKQPMRISDIGLGPISLMRAL